MAHGPNSDLPFRVSFEALALIRKKIREMEANPDFPDEPALAPVLRVSSTVDVWDSVTREVIERIPQEHYPLVWQLAEALTHTAVMDVLGKRVFVDSEALARLTGRELVVAALDPDGRPPNAGRPLLVAVRAHEILS